jgi:hypothetical protein
VPLIHFIQAAFLPKGFITNGFYPFGNYSIATLAFYWKCFHPNIKQQPNGPNVKL